MNVIIGTPISAAATNVSFNSAPIEPVAPSGAFKFSAIAKGSNGTTNGSLQLQVSNTPTNSSATYNWVNLGSPLTISGTTVALLTAIDMSYARARFAYTDSSAGASTATLTVETCALSYR